VSAAAPSSACGQRPTVYIVGDIHLRADNGPFPLFLDRLAQLPPARLVILGDLFEYWLETADAVTRYAPVLARLRALAAAGWRLDLVRGNREMAAGRRLAAASGCRLHWPRLDLRLGQRRVRIVHGDRLIVDPGYRALRAWIGSFWHAAWQLLHPAAVQDAVARFLRRSSRSQRPRAYRVITVDPRALRATARGACDSVVAGHIHEQWRRTIGGVDLLLVGDWPDSIGQWVEGYADGRLVHRRDDFSEPAHG
jgi:UDP-2,3-diacylglucosamine hydrolase